MKCTTFTCGNRSCRKAAPRVPTLDSLLVCPHCGLPADWKKKSVTYVPRSRKLRVELTAHYAREIFKYSDETGVLTRKITTSNRAKAGSVCNSEKANGYLQVEVLGHNYLLHRVIWLIVKGRWPSKYLDHIDGDPKNNRISNLRDVTHTVNLQNLKRAKSNNRSGLLGVTADVRNGVFMARIVVNGVTKQIGRFDTPE